MNPNLEKLLNLLEHARLWEENQKSDNDLKKTTRNCNACQKFAKKPFEFRGCLPMAKNLAFRDELLFDIMFFEENAVLHFVDTATRFSAFTFLDKSEATYG